MNTRIFATLGVALLLGASLASAQDPLGPMREELIKLNYIRVHDSQLQSLLIPFLSREGRIHFSDSQNMISLKDYQPNVDKILAVLKQIDRKPADILFTVQLVLASTGEDIGTEDAFAGDPVIKELKSLLKYRNFALLDTSLVRAMDRAGSLLTMGSGQAEFTLHLVPIYILEETAETIKVELRLNQTTGWQKDQSGVGGQTQKRLIESTLSLRPGDKTVVGVSKLDGGDKAVILIISGKLIK